MEDADIESAYSHYESVDKIELEYAEDVTVNTEYYSETCVHGLVPEVNITKLDSLDILITSRSFIFS